MINLLGREGLDRPYEGAFARRSWRVETCGKKKTPAVVDGIEAALDRLELRSGMTVSFHHHLRNGDTVLDQVMRALRRRGLKNLTVAASSIFPAHAVLVDCFADETVTSIETAYASGPVAAAISSGQLKNPALIMTHGGRARAILEGECPIDIAFIAAPAVDAAGRISGVGSADACGSLGYAVADAWRAEQVVALSSFVSETDLLDPDIEAGTVDFICRVDSIGDTSGIVSGTTEVTRDPVGLVVARQAADLIENSGLFADGFSFQTGAGGISLAVTQFVRERMRRRGLVGGFGCGGITKVFCDMLAEGQLRELYDVQAFDLDAVRSSAADQAHRRISASRYANPNEKDHVASRLDVVVLGASEIDLDFNVNVTTGSDGRILGGSGGHADTAAGAGLSVIVSKLVSGRVSCVVDRVTTVTTPGDTVDVLVTDCGVAVNPRHEALIDRLRATTRLDLVSMETLLERALALTGRPRLLPRAERVIGYSVYRDGTILDALHAVSSS